jgi:hypothetical protein
MKQETLGQIRRRKVSKAIHSCLWDMCVTVTAFNSCTLDIVNVAVSRR